MNIDHNTINRIAHLARLEVNESEKEALLEDMNNILSFMDKLNELDTTGVEPLIYLTDEVNVYRDDVVKQEITVADALRNAPTQDGKYFKVAKVIR
ncbi:Asp-tRNA(Asn)/Glu-tRNA(Gln) amidotransferase subunit GatC [Hufsiella ginkgonis]|uniref:Aspartyl/glutamyl-tRNA(Asn/Gln) amidotransferase subunit C n=1 Tax=Hufsiella ginkgonis TaxID=2695274 RepID=A0A7K1XX26_9SPHI|nr:Asp-tRNA(Asn)/Glu-tRNA(Gln) amidotransferase subunit GatC [Hufsiella ginkgonis]MXV15551.1 Asp-tRNA(Asn)/Glu-tRNA(Gln) amidotransferase subunit GatC [Hufsiella ginkgonis]